MAYQYIDIYPKKYKTFPKKVVEQSYLLTRLLGTGVQWDINDDKITISCDREFIDLGVAIESDMEEGLITDNVVELYNWAKKGNIIVKSDCRNESNFEFGPKDAKEFFDMIDNRSLSNSDIEGIKGLLSALKEYDHDAYCWEYIKVNGRGFFALCDSYEPIEDLKFIWLIQVLPNGDLGKEIKLEEYKKPDSQTEVMSCIEVDDYIYLLDNSRLGLDSKVTIYDYDFNVKTILQESELVAYMDIDRIDHDNRIEFCTFPYGDLAKVYNSDGVLILDNEVTDG